MTTTAIDITSLRTAIENRDADGVLAWYAPGAILRVVDRDHPPTTPLLYRGTAEIGDYYRDLCGRNIDHELHNIIVTADGLAFAQHCRYPDGTRVLCTTVATLDHGKISEQTAVQAWDV